MTVSLRDLLAETPRSPRDVAEKLLNLGIPRSVAWQAIVALSAISAILTWASLQFVPLPSSYPDFASQPLPNFVVEAGGTILFVHVLAWVGRLMGGQGRVDDLLVVITWLVLVRMLIKAVGVLLLAAMPPVAGFFLLAAGLFSFWLLLNFVAAGHRLDSVWAALGVVICAVVVIAIGAAFMLGMLGVGSIGGVGNV